jgi:hypothetical protein
MDTTSLSFTGAGGATLGERGYSKDHRPDLMQSKRCSATLRRDSDVRVAVAVPRATASIHRCASAASRSPGV